MSDIHDIPRRGCRPAGFERALVALAERQHGVVALTQLHALGLGTRGVEHRVARGRLHRLHHGVYAVGHASLSIDARRIAAVLACGPGAVLSHRAAAAAWGLRATSRLRFEVTTPRLGARTPQGIELHRARSLPVDDVDELRGIPITSVARTLVDLAAVLGRDPLERAVHEAEVLRLIDVAAVRAVLARSPGRGGTGRLRAILAEPGPGPTRGALEERFLALCRRALLPTPRCNVHLPTDGGLIEVDALWGRERVVVELDGAAVHRTARAFHADRRRDAALAARGFVVVRLTWQRVTQEPEAVVTELGRILAVRAGSG